MQTSLPLSVDESGEFSHSNHRNDIYTQDHSALQDVGGGWRTQGHSGHRVSSRLV